ncbi:MAG TPA: RidA family protein [Stellaceae bacterium]|nr:RidA family protein [Stellaceae bacterium]
MNKAFSPPTVATPTGYSHGVELGANARIVYVAGQVGTAPDGSIAKDIRGQATQAWKNIENVLAAAGMELKDIVKINHYLTRKEDIAAYREVRGKALGSHQPASTLLVISALAREDFLVEVECVAAK